MCIAYKLSGLWCQVSIQVVRVLMNIYLDRLLYLYRRWPGDQQPRLHCCMPLCYLHHLIPLGHNTFLSLNFTEKHKGLDCICMQNLIYYYYVYDTSCIWNCYRSITVLMYRYVSLYCLLTSMN